MSKTYRIGVYRNAGSGWHGGQIYFDNLIELLGQPSDTPVDLVVIEKERSLSPSAEERPRISVAFLSDYLEREKERSRRETERARELRKQKRKEQRKLQQGRWSRLLGPGREPEAEEVEEQVPAPSAQEVKSAAFEVMVREQRLDFVFPLPATACRTGLPGAAWIPDLQHCFLPEFFSQSDIDSRNEMFESFAGAETVVFSSEASRLDFQKHYPQADAKLEVWSFSGNPPKELFRTDPVEVVERYRLPERFFLVANQFWKHKDHAVVVEALARLQSEGLSVPVVMTGALRDYRGTGHIDELLQSIQRGGIHASVHLLGFLDRQEQWQLMRSALAVIQPSRFEGWSTVVEDCKAIGQRLILSDLAVHQEQAPPNSAYFPVGDAGGLAERIREWMRHGAEEWLRDRASRESRAQSDLAEARVAARRRFLEIVERSQAGGDAEGRHPQRPRSPLILGSCLQCRDRRS